ncbi:MAG: proline--tRNA ligase, partial [Nitrospiria bacterium]
MYYSKLLIPTLREDPSDAEIVSHRLMLRAGFMRQLSAGIYSLLPLGYRVLTKVKNIVREEMENADAQEILLSALQPAELWEETGRWQRYGKELMRLHDRHNRDFCLGPTHEEVITDLVRNEVRSYRQLPLNLFQIQTKFRDEIRPRFGLMRGREFIMKDAYSFDANEQDAKESYQKMVDCYHRIFQRVGLRFRAVEADTGLIGGSSSHEFMVLAQTGEEAVISCTKCGYAANIERAELRRPENTNEDQKTPSSEKPIELVETPGKKSVEEVRRFLKVSPKRLIKTLVFLADDHPVLVLVRGDHEVHEIKLRHFLKVTELTLADAATVEKVTGGPSGFSGPVGMEKIQIVADFAVEHLRDCVVGANRKDTHYIHARPGRDFNIVQYADLRNVVADDPCPRCGETIQIERGIEVGHVFMLGTKYSEAMNARFLDQNGVEQPFVMGCYGIGVSRIVAASVEQNHDEKGIIWPQQIAPFSVLVIPVQDKSEAVMESARSIYTALLKAGIDTLFEDRSERAGVKFNDADLLGIPFHLVIGERNLKNGLVELKNRKTGQKEMLPLGSVVETF